MPAVMRIGPYRFFFYSNESGERQHIHVCAGGEEAKFWLEPLEMAWNWGFSERQLSQIERHIRDNLAFLMEAGDEFFGRENMADENVQPREADRPVAVEIENGLLRVTLQDGRVIATPLHWYPRLAGATPEQQVNYELGFAGVHWPDIDEDLSVSGMLKGQHGAHSPRATQAGV